MASKLHEEKRYIIVGKPNIKYGRITFSHPDVVETEAPEETVNDEGPATNITQENYNTGRIFPIYSELMGIKPGRFAQKMRNLMDKVDEIFHEYLPEELLQKF